MVRWRRRPKARATRPPGTDWTCHVCGDWRPDAQISVYSRTRRLYPGGIEATENVRYCNDRPECVAGAPHYHHIKGHGS